MQIYIFPYKTSFERVFPSIFNIRDLKVIYLLEVKSFKINLLHVYAVLISPPSPQNPRVPFPTATFFSTPVNLLTIIYTNSDFGTRVSNSRPPLTMNAIASWK